MWQKSCDLRGAMGDGAVIEYDVRLWMHSEYSAWTLFGAPL